MHLRLNLKFNADVLAPLRWERVSLRYLLLVVVAAAVLPGPRRMYVIFEATSLVSGILVLLRVGPRYWGRGMSGSTH